jgi:vitamin B12 transporter
MSSPSSKVARGDSYSRLRRFCRVLPCFLTCAIFSSDASGQEKLPGIDIGAETVVTPDRVEEPARRTASSVTVVSAAEIQKRGSKGFADVLRGVPGLDIVETGGPGAQTSVFLRGSTPGQTLVLIDGIRIGDASSADGSVDLGGLVVTDIERIEVLRGPQSALYGSDAMGGVINIITRKGEGKPRGWLLTEGGRYATAHGRASISGSEDRLSYAFAVDGLHTDSFPRYGYRIARPLTIGDGVTPLPPLPWADPTTKGGATARLAYRLTDDVVFEGGFTGYDSSIRFDNPFAFVAADVFDPFNHQHSTFLQGFARVDADLFDHRLHNRLTLFANVTNRDVWQTESCFDANFNALNCRLGFRGGRRGLEYQGDLKLGPLGLVTFGARNETESAHTSQDPATPDTFTPINTAQTTHSGFVQHQFALLDRIDLTYGGRVDAVEGNHTFETWRTTAAFRIEETGTKLRATAGSGARVASLFQRFSQYGDPALLPETSVGFDVGVDQKLFDGRVFASVSLYDNRFRNLIDFGPSPSCSATQVFGCYFNVGRAETKGVEFAGEAVIVPDEWRIRATYTYLVAKNLVTERTLFRRPRDKGSASIIYTGIPGLELEARVTVVGPNPDFDFIASRRVTLTPYARLDIFANYKLDDRLSIFGRIENVGDVRYEEVLNYGTAGRSFYGGMKFTW